VVVIERMNSPQKMGLCGSSFPCLRFGPAGLRPREQIEGDAGAGWRSFWASGGELVGPLKVFIPLLRSHGTVFSPSRGLRR